MSHIYLSHDSCLTLKSCVDNVITDFMNKFIMGLTSLAKVPVNMSHEACKSTMTSFPRTKEGSCWRLTEEGKNCGQVPCRAKTILSFHDNLTEISRRWTIRSCHHINTVRVRGRSSSCQLTLCCCHSRKCGRTCAIRVGHEEESWRTRKIKVRHIIEWHPDMKIEVE
jgi:hypothetical protein